MPLRKPSPQMHYASAGTTNSDTSRCATSNSELPPSESTRIFTRSSVSPTFRRVGMTLTGALLASCAPDAPEMAPEPSGSAQYASAPITAPAIAATGLHAGAAEASADLPIGVPLAAYTSRLHYSMLGVDRRTSAYTTEFSPSAGSQSRIPIKVIWLQNNGQNVVFVKVDIGYAFDGVLFQMEDDISAATGIDVHDKVIFSTSHSHSSYGCFSHDPALYLGSDQFNTEIFTRLSSQIADVAQAALAGLAPASIGVGFDPEFDPVNVDKIFRDRRGENDDLVGVDGEILGRHKDPRLTLVRIDKSNGTTDTSDDTPLALIHSFGMHGTIMGGDNMLTSVESTGHVDLKVQERFNRPVVVMHLQGAAGDQSPAGIQDNFARMESLGEIAAPKIISLHTATRTRTGDVSLELLTRSIHQNRDEMRIRRQGTTDYYYTPYTDRYKGDDIVYDANGKVISPIDEFNTEFGAALCTDDESMKYVGKLFGWGSNVAPYYTCGNVDEIINLMDLPIFNFDLGWVDMPMLSSQSTVISALQLKDVPITSTDGTNTQDSVVFGIFPGEPVSLYSDVFRDEVGKVHGYKYVVTIGYSQDHEGYLLTLEDWLAGGYEPEINVWGPIQGEYVLEQVVDLVGQFGINNPNIPSSSKPDTQYEYFPLEPAEPDYVTDAGTVPNRVPSYLYTWDGVMPLTVQPELQVPRVTGLATFVWKGGDSIIDNPSITLERETSTGAWQTVVHPSGRPWSEAGYQILLTYTPDPLDHTQQQTHYWMASFQTVTDEPSLDYSAGMALGRYRFRVVGKTVAQDPGTFPWNTDAYVLYSNPFEVVAQTGLTVSATYASGKVSISAAYPANERGFRLISMNADNERSTNPLNKGNRSSVQASVAIYDSSNVLQWQAQNVTFTTQQGASLATVTPATLPAGTYSLVVTDVFGNLGKGSLTIN